MASTYTPLLRLAKPGLNDTGWGTTVNDGTFELIDNSIAGLVSVDVTSGNVTLTTANGATDQARNMFIRAFGASVARDVVVPATSKLYLVINDCTAAVTFKVSGLTGVAVPAGKTAILRCNGTDVVAAVTYLTELTTGGNVNAVDVVASGDVTATGDVSGDNVTATGDVSGVNVTATGDVSGVNVTATGDVSGVDLIATGDVSGTSFNSGQLAGFRNKIINGAMTIAQRGTSFPAPASGSYSLDRWGYAVVGTTGVVTLSQSSDNPTDEYVYSLRAAVTTADAAVAAGDVAAIYQKIEGFNARDLIGRTFTISFWVRSSKTGTHCVFLGNSANNRSYVAEYTVVAANTWEKKSITISGGLITAGTWNWTNGVGLQVGFTLIAGTTYQNTAGTWQTGNFLATSAQVNCLDSNTNIFAITGVQLEVGSVATPFEHRLFGAELALCQRYARPAPLGRLGGYATSGTGVIGTFTYPTMRVGPTLTGATYFQSNTTGAALSNFLTERCNFSAVVSSTAGFDFEVTAGFLSSEL